MEIVLLVVKKRFSVGIVRTKQLFGKGLLEKAIRRTAQISYPSNVKVHGKTGGQCLVFDRFANLQ
jgi:hypothetical protein